METRESVIDLLDNIAARLELTGENPFKIRAYHNASRAIAALEGDLKEQTLSGGLKNVKGIGQSIFETIRELIDTGRSSLLEELKKEIPESLMEMLEIPGLGPKKVKVIYEKLGISTLGELEYACLENRLLTLEGFGEKTQENILQGIRHWKKGSGYFHYDRAFEEAKQVLNFLEKSTLFHELELAGSLRRHKEVVKDIDLVGSSENPAAAMACFTSLPLVDRVVAHGETKSSVLLKSGIHADLRIVTPEQFPFALHHFTGSREHNTALRGVAKDLGFKMNEYGLFREGDTLVPCKSEKEIFGALGFKFIPPELRENLGEFEPARTGSLPSLVEPADIRGIFHVHTTYSDGKNSLSEIIGEAIRLGYEYIGISDHSRSAFYAHGLSEEDIQKQHDEIDRLQKQHAGIRIFKGIESDILDDGSLDYPDKILSAFDFVIGSVHSRFKMDEPEMTRRMLNALANPYLTMLGHLTGRLLLSRPSYPLDLEAVLEGARKGGVIIELNANPHRFELDWRDCRRAKEKGIKVSINPDAHGLDHLRFTEYGVGIARKGWLSPEDVFNTLSLKKVDAWLNERKTKAG